jgi:hypothetical protein
VVFSGTPDKLTAAATMATGAAAMGARIWRHLVAATPWDERPGTLFGTETLVR